MAFCSSQGFLGPASRVRVSAPRTCVRRRPRPAPIYCAAVRTAGTVPEREAYTNAPQILTFESRFGGRIPAWLVNRLYDIGFRTPTDVQLRALDVALPPSGTSSHTIGEDLADEETDANRAGTAPGKDVVIHAQTGCGKTLAYLLPIIAAVDPTRASVQGLILVPTQELGMQVYKTLRRLTVAWSHSDDNATAGAFPVLPMLNQADLRRQKLQLRRTAPRVIVGNPHRIAELVESGRLRLDLLRVLVVDEFDACLLDTSTTRALQVVLGTRGREPRQTILASATVPQHRHFLRQCVRQRWTNDDIEHVWVEETLGQRVPSTLRHCYALVDGRKKLSALRALLGMFGEEADSGDLPPKAIVFVMASRPVVDIVDALNVAITRGRGEEQAAAGKPTSNAGPIVGLSNDMSVLQRARAMRRFRSGSARVLVATDVAARGLDVQDVSHVFHVDTAVDADAYLHRAGRAGRLGKDGVSVTLVTQGEEFVIRRVGNALGIQFERVGGSNRIDR